VAVVSVAEGVASVEVAVDLVEEVADLVEALLDHPALQVRPDPWGRKVLLEELDPLVLLDHQGEQA
jgi:hypothetical protein